MTIHDNTPILDTHFHIWNTQELTLPWLKLFKGKLRSRYTLDDYLKSIKNYNITRSCYVEVDALKEQHKQEALMAINLCNDPSNQLIAVTIGGDMSQESFSDYIHHYTNEGCVKSVRHNFFASDPIISLEKVFINNTNLLGKLHIMMDLVLAADKIFHGVNLVKACPNTIFIVDHCGLCPIHGDAGILEIWREGILAYAQQPNTICKISEVGFLTPDYQWQIADMVEIIKHCVMAFGEERVIYGSNWPVCEMTSTVGQWIEAIKQSLNHYPPSFFDNLFYKNAEKYYVNLDRFRD